MRLEAVRSATGKAAIRADSTVKSEETQLVRLVQPLSCPIVDTVTADSAVIRNGATMKSRLSGTLAKVVLVAALSSTAMPAGAQQSGAIRSTHGAWSIICDTPAGATAEQCVMMQNVIAPLGVLLPNGLGLNVDGKDIGRAYFVRCFQDGCYAEVILEKPLLDTLKGGTSATFIVFQTPEEGIGIPVDLNGFDEGFAALPK
jgi:invasion protein IalB